MSYVRTAARCAFFSVRDKRKARTLSELITIWYTELEPDSNTVLLLLNRPFFAVKRFSNKSMPQMVALILCIACRKN